MRVIIVGRDEHGLGSALDSEGSEVVCIDGFADRTAFDAADIGGADAVALTDPLQATAIPVARELNDDLRIVVYADESLPEFAQPLADLIVDPALIEPGTLAEEF